MENAAKLEQLIKCLIHVIGRSAVPPDEVHSLVGSARTKSVRAFNMCDGTHTQSEIARKLKIDPASLSRTSARWVESGIAFDIGEGNEVRLLHIYPIRPGNRRNDPKPQATRKLRAARR